jgi:hypothetical protein
VRTSRRRRPPRRNRPARKRARLKARKPPRPEKPRATPKREPKAGKKSAKQEAAKTTAPRAESKGAKVLALIERAKGVTLAEIMKTTAWQAHSVRGFLSTAAKKHGLKIESTRTESGDRLYKIAG